MQQTMSPATFIARLESAARRVFTPCGGGQMLWRIWGDGPPLVLLHGGSGSWLHWARLIPRLAQGRKVLAADMPGFGHSDALPVPITGSEVLAPPIADGMRALVPEPLDIAGFSFGGIIGAHVAALLGDRVRSLAVICSGGLALPPAPLPRLQRATPDMSAAQRSATYRANLRALMFADPAAADDLAVYIHAENLARSRVSVGQIPHSDDMLRALPGVRGHVAGLWGSRDMFAAPDPAACEGALRRVRPDIRFVLLPGVGHWATHEAPDAVESFLAETAAHAGGGAPQP